MSSSTPGAAIDQVRVLLVDDEPAQSELTMLYLGEVDPSLAIESVSTPEGAQTRLLERTYDCVLSDYQMPGMDGIQLCEEVRKFSSIPFILYTGRGSEEVASRAFLAGVDDYVRKEKEIAHYGVLTKRIRQTVEKKRLEQINRIILDDNRDGSVIIQGLKIRYLNKAMADMLGEANPAEVVGKDISTWLLDEEREKVGQRAIRRQRGEDQPSRYEYLVKRADGSIRTLEASAYLVNYLGEPASLVFNRDVTELKETEMLAKAQHEDLVDRQARYRRIGSLTVAVTVIIIGLVAVLGLHEPIIEPPYLAFTLYIAFFVVCIAVAAVSAGSYLGSGSPSLAMLGCALLINGLSTTIANTPLGFSPNTVVTLANLGILSSAAVQFIGAVMTSVEVQPTPVEHRRVTLASIYGASILLVAVLAGAALYGSLPVFFTSTGPTVMRQIVVVILISLLFFSSGLFGLKYLKSRSETLFWYSHALALYGFAMLGSLFTLHLGGPMSWITRIATYLSGAFFMVALVNRESRLEAYSSIPTKWSTAFGGSHGEMSSLFSKIMNGVMYCKSVTDEKGNPADYVWIEVNDAFEKIYGMPRRDVIGKRATEVFPGHENDMKRWIGIFGLVAMGKGSVEFEKYNETLGKWLHATVYSPRPGYFVSIFEDITRRMQDEEELQRYSASLEAKVVERTLELRLNSERLVEAERMEAVGKLTAMLAHDLRNPLNTVYQAADMIQSNPERSERLLQMIKESTSRSLGMIEELRSATREITVNRAATDLAPLIRDVVEGIKVPGNVSVRLDTPESLSVSVDSGLMRRVVENLVSNAVEAMPRGGALTIRTVRNGDGTRIMVEDTGTGIPPEVAPRIFNSFYTSKAKGMGLGLAFSRRAVQAHGGALTFTTKIGAGTTFTVALPASLNTS